MFGINQLVQTKQPNTLGGAGASVAVSAGLLTLVVIGGIAYLIFK